MPIVRRGDNFRRDIPEAQKFVYPSDSQRLTGEKAKLIGVDVFNTLFNIVRAPDSVGRIVDEVKDIANRPLATPQLHKRYLDNKYGDKQWDVYVDRDKNEAYNSDYYYNQQDLGNGNTFTQRESKRFAGDLLSDEWLQDIRAHGIEQDMLEEKVEQIRQEKGLREYFGDKVFESFVDPKNPARSAEQQLSRALLYEGQSDPIIQPDRIRAADIDQPEGVLGIDDRYFDDSEIRSEVVGNMGANGLFNLERTGVTTEILSPQGQRDAYLAWEGGNIRNSSGLRSFNEAAGEYYGQQALKMTGVKPVKDEDRTSKSRLAEYSDERNGTSKTTMGTDRLIEHNRSLSSGPIDQFEPADYRFVGQDGKVHVLDYQVGDTSRSGELHMNLFKASELRPGDERKFAQTLQQEAQRIGSDNFDEVMKSVIEKNTYGSMKMGQGAASRDGFRSGKLTSDAPYMGMGNSVENNTRYEGVLYGVTDPKRRNKKGGYIPDDFVMLEGKDARQQIGEQLLQGHLDGLRIYDGGKVEVVQSTPDSYAILDRHQKALIQQPYALDKPMGKREPMAPPEFDTSAPIGPRFDNQGAWQSPNDPNIDATGNKINMAKIRAARKKREASIPVDLSKLSPQERYERKQLELQNHFGGPRVDPNWQGGRTDYSQDLF